jgi:hypothetical protein
MSNTSIQLKKSGATGNTPPDLNYGEVAINYADGKLYYKNDAAVIKYITNQDSFSTVIANGSSILALSGTDILTINPTTGITISGNVTSKTITIGVNETQLSTYTTALLAYGHANAAFEYANNLVVSSNDEWARGQANAAFIQANAAFAAANSATGSSAGPAFDQANAAFAQANTATDYATSAGNYANGAFAQANTATDYATSAGSYANSAYNQANTATDYATSAGSYANSAYNQANTATDYSTSAGNYANGAFIQANSVATLAQNAYDSSNTKYSKTGGEISGDVTITGNLTVGGTQKIENSKVVAINDNMLYLNSPLQANINNAVGDGANVIYTTVETNYFSVGDVVTITGITPSSLNISGASNTAIIAVTANTFTVNSSITDAYSSGGIVYARVATNPDIGFSAGYNDGTYHHTGLFRDATDGIYKFFYNYTPEPEDSLYINTNDASFRIANLTANLITDVITLRGYDPLDHTNAAFTQANTGIEYATSAGNYANAAFGATNTATSYAQSAGSYANAAFTVANTASAYATSAGSYANSAYTQANVISSYANSQITLINGVDATQNTNITTATNYATSAGNYANGAFTVANNAVLYATSAGNYANAAFAAANSSSSSAAAYNQANSAFNQANAAFAVANTAVTTSGAATLTNKRIDPRTNTSTSFASVTPDISAFDQYNFTALAATLAINAPVGSPSDGNKLIFRILDNGVSQTLNWNGTYTAIGVVIPTATTAGKMTYVGCVYNSTNLRWDVIAVSTQI